MPYTIVLNKAQGIDKQSRIELNNEFTDLRAELNDLRTKYAALLAALEANVGIDDPDFGDGLELAAAQFTPT